MKLSQYNWASTLSTWSNILAPFFATAFHSVVPHQHSAHGVWVTEMAPWDHWQFFALIFACEKPFGSSWGIGSIGSIGLDWGEENKILHSSFPLLQSPVKWSPFAPKHNTGLSPSLPNKEGSETNLYFRYHYTTASIFTGTDLRYQCFFPAAFPAG